ncbi:MAG TPA: hypothetical protein ENK18_05275 [Deltaproteobacteria bacterium]|nr:hypothetical protein [Deltaproteobacteria bacterium]
MQPELSRQLYRLGIDAESLDALLLLPLIEVAWADGVVQRQEQQHIAGVSQAWDPGEEAMLLVRTWIRYPPSEAYCERARRALAELLNHSAPQHGPWDAETLLEEAHAVASAAGSWLPFLRICRSEREVLNKLRQALIPTGDTLRMQPPTPIQRHRTERPHPDLDRRINPVTLDFDTQIFDIEASGGVLIPDFVDHQRFTIPPHGLVVGGGEGSDLRVLDCPQIAPTHCGFVRRGNRFYLQELGGETRVNGERILERRLLGGETLRLAPGVTFAFKRVRHIPPQLV